MTTRSFDRTAAQCGIARTLAERLRKSRQALATQWLEAIMEHDTLEAPRPPTSEMVDGMPLLIDGIAWHLEHPDECLSTDTPVVKQAMQIGTLRHGQGYTAKDILEEYELLGRLLFDYLATTVGDGNNQSDAPRGTVSSALLCASLLFHAIVVIEITTTTHYLQSASARVVEREERLRAFNRAVSHEIKNRIGTVMNASGLLAEQSLSPDRQHHLAEIIGRNAREMTVTVDNLLVLARVEDDPSEHRRVSLGDAVAGAIENAAPFAATANVHMQIAADLPDVEVDDPVVHLSLANYLHNAIKYADMAAEDRFVCVGAAIEASDGAPMLVLRVADNGIGVPEEKREGLFRRFFRAHEQTHHDGSGLGLSIVSASVNSIGGRAWAEFPDKGSVFAIALPVRPDARGSHSART